MRPLSVVRLSTAAVLACSCVLLVGCGPSTQDVTGKIVPPPNMKFYENDSISLRFYPDTNDPKAQAFFADVNPKDLTFSTKVPSGKYKLGLEVSGYPGEKTTTQKRIDALNEFNSAYSRERSPISYEVTSGPQNITVELAQGRAFKN